MQWFYISYTCLSMSTSGAAGKRKCYHGASQQLSSRRHLCTGRPEGTHLSRVGQGKARQEPCLILHLKLASQSASCLFLHLKYYEEIALLHQVALGEKRTSLSVESKPNSHQKRSCSYHSVNEITLLALGKKKIFPGGKCIVLTYLEEYSHKAGHSLHLQVYLWSFLSFAPGPASPTQTPLAPHCPQKEIHGVGPRRHWHTKAALWVRE